MENRDAIYVESIDPGDGGCWYCYDDQGWMQFSLEFDTYVHADCIRRHIEVSGLDDEAKILAREILPEYR